MAAGPGHDAHRVGRGIAAAIAAEHAFMIETVGQALGKYGDMIIDQIEKKIAEEVGKLRAEVNLQRASDDRDVVPLGLIDAGHIADHGIDAPLVQMPTDTDLGAWLSQTGGVDRPENETVPTDDYLHSPNNSRWCWCRRRRSPSPIASSCGSKRRRLPMCWSHCANGTA